MSYCVLFNCHAFAGLENQINEFVTALKDADLGEEKEKKIGMELKSLMDKASASAAKSQVAPNKAKVAYVQRGLSFGQDIKFN